MFQIQTKRLEIRPFTEQDLDAFAEIVKDPEVMRFSISGTLSRDGAREYLQKRILDHYAKYGYGLWALIDREERGLVGFAGLITQMIEGEQMVELGYRLDTKRWGQGLATEAGQAICRYAFGTLKFSRIISVIEPNNDRSVRVAERLGMHIWKKATFHGISVNLYILENK